jgi:hypothetical protein
VSGAFFERAVLKSILGWKEEEEYEALRVASSVFVPMEGAGVVPGVQSRVLAVPSLM